MYDTYTYKNSIKKLTTGYKQIIQAIIYHRCANDAKNGLHDANLAASSTFSPSIIFSFFTLYFMKHNFMKYCLVEQSIIIPDYRMKKSTQRKLFARASSPRASQRRMTPKQPKPSFLPVSGGNLPQKPTHAHQSSSFRSAHAQTFFIFSFAIL